MSSWVGGGAGIISLLIVYMHRCIISETAHNIRVTVCICGSPLVEIEHYSVAYFDRITASKRSSAELLLRAGLIHIM